jgi:hypothetical protein
LHSNVRRFQGGDLRRPISIALISTNNALRYHIHKPPFIRNYKVFMFTTIHGTMLANHDIIILDGGLSFTVESYITREHAKWAFLQNRRRASLAPSDKSPYPNKAETFPRSFPDFAKLYNEYDFPAFADLSEHMLDKANEQLNAWKSHLRNEGGYSVIRVRDPQTSEMLAKRCILLPSRAVNHWKDQLNRIVMSQVELALAQFPAKYMARFGDYNEIEKLFYVKRIGMNNSARKLFERIPLWKLDVMLKKWRTDKALEEWIANYQFT